jgi:hypothetical protein
MRSSGAWWTVETASWRWKQTNRESWWWHSQWSDRLCPFMWKSQCCCVGFGESSSSVRFFHEGTVSEVGCHVQRKFPPAAS